MPSEKSDNIVLNKAGKAAFRAIQNLIEAAEERTVPDFWNNPNIQEEYRKP